MGASAPALHILGLVRDTSEVFISRFRCATEDTARRLVNTLLVAGLYPELHEPRTPDQAWEVAAPAELVASEANLADLRTAMRQAAERTGTAFEGCDPEDLVEGWARAEMGNQ
jgi:hypothetical protein